VNYDIEFTESEPFEVVVTTAGKATAAEMADGRRRLLDDPRFRAGMSLLVDHSLLDNSGITRDEVQRAAMSLNRDRARSGLEYIALVAPTTMNFGLARMFEALAGDDLEGSVIVVRTREEAYSWIESQRATAGSAQPN
jgi:hypothetical protein